MSQQFTQSTSVASVLHSVSVVEKRWQHAESLFTTQDHFYLQAMDIDPAHLDIRYDAEAKQLLIPMFSRGKRQIIDLMLIGEDGLYSRLVQNNVCYSKITGHGEGHVFCQDFASGYMLWLATGRTVIVCWEHEQLKPVIDMLPSHPNDIIALDSATDHTAWVISARATELPFYMPLGDLSFNKLGVDGTRKVLAHPPVSKVPVFPTKELEYLELSGNQMQWFRELSTTQCPRRAASLTFSIARRLLPGVPVSRTMPELKSLLKDAVKKPVIHPLTLDNIWKHLDGQIALRREKALGSVTLPRSTLSSHRVEVYEAGIPTILSHEWHGVIVAQAPMAAGKTQLIGRPLSDWAAANQPPFMALCHRVSLTTELANRLALNNYSEKESIDSDRGLAICLPSITKPDFGAYVEQNKVLFIDEISQVLRFLASKDYCRTSHAPSNEVFERLKRLVAKAECVVVADANIDARTIKFLETCRPGERFRIISVPAPEDAGIQATYYFGKDSLGHIAQQGIAELDSGGKIWIAAESIKSVKALEKIFVERGYRTLAIYSANKGGTPQSRFLANADAESVHYDVVIASPVIGSGISIQHDYFPEKLRFTLGLYVGGGYAQTPADAFQQMRRVRYLNRFVIGFSQLGKKNPELNSEAQVQAVQVASALEESDLQVTPFDHYVADIQAEDTRAKSDFAAGLLWQLDAAGWHLVASSHRPNELSTKAQAQAAAYVKNRYIEAVVSAPALNDIEAIELQRLRNRTEAQNLMLEAHALRTSLGLGDAPITRELVDFWDHGRGIKKLDLFDALRGIVPKKTKRNTSAINEEYPIATAKVLRWLFTDINFLQPYRDETASIVADRILDQSNLLRFLGIISTSNKHNGQPTRLMNRLLKNIGFTVKETQKRRVECGNKISTNTSNKGNPTKRFYAVTLDSYEKLERLADRRNRQRDTVQLNDAWLHQAGLAPSKLH